MTSSSRPQCPAVLDSAPASGNPVYQLDLSGETAELLLPACEQATQGAV